jgi:hypothetical protein
VTKSFRTSRARWREGPKRGLYFARDTGIALVKLRSSLAVPNGGLAVSLGPDAQSPPASCRNTVVKTAALVTGEHRCGPEEANRLLPARDVCRGRDV